MSMGRVSGSYIATDDRLRIVHWLIAFICIIDIWPWLAPDCHFILSFFIPSIHPSIHPSIDQSNDQKWQAVTVVAMVESSYVHGVVQDGITRLALHLHF